MKKHEEIRPGYKSSEAGIIPKDWQALQLGQIGFFKNGINKPKEAFGSGFPFVNLMDVFGIPKVSSRNGLGLLNTSVAERNTYDLRAGDVLFVRSSVKPSGVGLTTVLDVDLEDTVFSGFLLRFRDNGHLEKTFKEYCFFDTKFRNAVVGSATVSANTNINQSALSQLWLAVPPPPEQRLIAEALGDADVQIAALEALIAKKRDLKQATMQQLLTGKTRLPGCDGDWRIIQLGRDATLKARIGWQGLTTAEYLETGACILVTGTEFKDGKIAWSECSYVDWDRYKQDPNIQLQAQDVLVTKDGTIGKVAFVRELPQPATLNSGVFVVRPRNGAFAPSFLYHVMTSRIFGDFLARLSAGSTIVHLYQKDFVDFTFAAPSTLDEQAEIAQILTDMDDELAALEAETEKARAIKQGMMQTLLTGKVRLV